MSPVKNPLGRTILLLAGSFTFAFLLGEMIHELGHFLAHRYFGTLDAGIHLDPFGGSRMYGVRALPLQQMGITTAAGPVLNLIGGGLTIALLWRQLRPGTLPLILWGPVSLVQEGVNLSLGLLSPGSDARWLVEWGVPPWLLFLLGIGFVIGAVVIFARILQAALTPLKTFWERFVLIFFGLASLMILRAVVSAFRSSAAVLENLIPLIFALFLAGSISAVMPVLRQVDSQRFLAETGWKDSLVAVGLGLGIILFQLILP